MSPVPAALQQMAGDLEHPLQDFDPDVQRANAQGWGNSQVLERFAWDYELLAQLRRVDPTAITAFGGTATMLHLPLETQRASVDVDVFCEDADRFEAIVRAVEARLTKPDPTGQFFRFEAADSELQVPIPKRAYHVVFPTATGAVWRKEEASPYQPGSHVKLEVLISPPPAREELAGARVLPFAKTGPHWVVPKVATTAMKLLALASGEVGLPPNRLTDLVKHIYDVSHLLVDIDTRPKLEELIAATKATLDLENRWHKPQSELGNCATAVRTTVGMLEATVIQEKAGAFAATYLRESPTSEEWAVWGAQVRHLAFVACRRHGIDDYIETKRVLERLFARRLPARTEKPLRGALVKKLRSLDLASGSASDRYPVVLFAEISFRVGHRAAAAVVEEILGAGWDN